MGSTSRLQGCAAALGHHGPQAAAAAYRVPAPPRSARAGAAPAGLVRLLLRINTCAAAPVKRPRALQGPGAFALPLVFQGLPVQAAGRLLATHAAERRDCLGEAAPQTARVSAQEETAPAPKDEGGGPRSTTTRSGTLSCGGAAVSLSKVAKDMLRRVFIAGNAGYFHGEAAGERWGARKRCLDLLKAAGLLRTSTTKEHPPRLLWHLTAQGAQLARALWCPSEVRGEGPPAPFIAMRAASWTPRPLAASPRSAMPDPCQARRLAARAGSQAAWARAPEASASSSALPEGGVAERCPTSEASAPTRRL